MVSIDYDHLNTHYFQCDDTATVAEVAQTLDQLPAPARDRWYVLVRLTGGGFAIIGLDDLQAALAAHGPEIRDRSLAAVPNLLHPSLSLERQGQGLGQARKQMRRSPKRRLVVQEAGQPVGLLTEEARAGGFGGLMSSLFGAEQPRYRAAPTLTYRCPHCPPGQNRYPFSALIDLESNELRCPNGHQIEVEGQE